MVNSEYCRDNYKPAQTKFNYLTMELFLQLFLDQVVLLFFIIHHPDGQVLFNDAPLLAFFFLHFEYKTVAAVIGNINMNQAAGGIGDHTEIEFAYPVGSL